MKRALTIAATLIVPTALFAQDDTAQTERDRSLIVAFIEDNLSSAGRDIRIEGFRGVLSNEATLDLLTIADEDGVWLTLENAVLDWNRRALLTGRLDVTRLSAQSIELTRLPTVPSDGPTPQATPFALPDLPVAIDIGAIEAERVRLGASVLRIGGSVDISVSGALQLADGSGAAHLDIARLDGPEGNFNVDASYSNDTEILALDLSLTEAAGGIVAGLINLPRAPELALSVAGEGPLDDFAAEIALSTENQPRLTGTVAIRAAEDVPADPETPPARVFDVDLAGDMSPLVIAEYAAFFGTNSALQATGTTYPDGQLSLDRFTLSTRALSLFGSLDLAADGLPTAFGVSGKIADPDNRAVLLPTAGTRTFIDGAELIARYDRAEGEAWTLSGDISNLQRDGLSVDTIALSGGGTIAREGTDLATLLRAVAAEIDIDALGILFDDEALATAVGPILSARSALRWRDGQPMVFDSLAIDAGDARLEAAGRLGGLSTGLEFTGSLWANAPDLARFAQISDMDLAGSASAKGRGTLHLLDGRFDLDLNANAQNLQTGVAQIDPIAGATTAIQLDAKRDETGLQLRNIVLATPTLDATATGVLSSDRDGKSSFDGQISADARDLSVFSALAGQDLSGSLQTDLEGALFLDASRFDLRGTAVATDLQTGMAKFDRIPGARTTIDIAAARDAGGISLSQFKVATPTLDAQGAGRFTDLDTDAPVFDGTVDLSATDLSVFAPLVGYPLRGGLDAQYAGRMSLDAQSFDMEATATATNLVTGIDRVDALTGARTVIDFAGAREGTEVSVRRGQLSSAALDATLSGAITGSQGALDLNARLDDVARLGTGLSGPLTVTGQLGRAVSGTAWRTDVNATGPGGASARVAGTLSDDFKTANLDLNGTAPLGLVNSFTSAALLQGTAAFDLALNGALELGSLSGRITTPQGARLVVVSQTLAFDINAATVDLQGNEARVDITAQAETGGQVSLAGPIGLSEGLRADLAVRLRDLVLEQPRLYRTSVSGDLSISGNLSGGALIAGQMELGETNISVNPTALGANEDVLDVTHLGAPSDVTQTRERAGLLASEGSTTTASRVAYPINVRVSAANRIFVRGRGLDAEMGGSLTVRGTTANVIPVGQFNLVRGRLSLLGNRIDMQEGQLTLRGDLDPTLRLVASTTTDDLTVSIILSGRVSTPELTLASSPELPEEEILSRLLFGRGITEITAIQAAQMAAAISTLTGGGGGLVGNIRDSFGLDDLDLTTSEEGDASLRVGKYLSEKVYTDVTIDSNGRSEINLNLDATDNVTIKGTLGSDGETGLGVFFEKDY
ncbi:translocation/assembly module TamB domain-containing protein [Celeribacter arenosi]|uniref:Translocation/assembly module TamB domain-containing protein n=1 Tax=Celeribacter arenosi TaxID=792649 RepID=A0ABP7K6H2_9RHOB